MAGYPPPHRRQTGRSGHGDCVSAEPGGRHAVIGRVHQHEEIEAGVPVSANAEQMRRRTSSICFSEETAEESRQMFAGVHARGDAYGNLHLGAIVLTPSLLGCIEAL